MTRTHLLIAAAGTIIVIVFVAVSISHRPQQDDQRPEPGNPAASAAAAASAPGGPALLPRPTAPGTGPAGTSASAGPRASASSSPTAAVDVVGSVQPVRSDANPQVASVAAALVNKDHPERLSTLVKPKDFNLAAFTQDKQAYIDVVEPGRAFQTAQPSPTTPVLHPLTPTQMSMRQDGQVILRVQAPAGSPVTYTSMDLGHFSNQLTSQTVLADANGVASVAYSAGPGTIDAVHVLAGSPLASGQVLFDIQVAPASHVQKSGI